MRNDRPQVQPNALRRNDSIRTVPGGVLAFAEAEENLRSRRVSEALEGYACAEKSGYDSDRCASGRWICRMLLGDFDGAWRESEAIERRARPDSNRFWKGEPLQNRHVMVRCLHGLGDTIQFIRYAPLLRSSAKSLTIQTQPATKRLLADSGLAEHVITWNEQEPNWDVQLEVVELPRIFGATLTNIPVSVPYLKATRSTGNRRSNWFNVGLVWASGSHDPARSIPLSLLSRICTAPGCRFFSFQAGEESSQLKQWGDHILDLQEEIGCVAVTASRMLDMDLMITVDTMAAHLSGALGKPTWTLLPFAADWRWMLKRTDSPWYPTMRLFRQAEPSDWESVVEEVRLELFNLYASGAAPGRVKKKVAPSPG